MVTGDPAVAVDVYTSCLESRAKEASTAAWLEPFVLQPAQIRGCGALAWLGLGQAHLRFCNYRWVVIKHPAGAHITRTMTALDAAP